MIDVLVCDIAVLIHQHSVRMGRRSREYIYLSTYIYVTNGPLAGQDFTNLHNNFCTTLGTGSPSRITCPPGATQLRAVPAEPPHLFYR